MPPACRRATRRLIVVTFPLDVHVGTASREARPTYPQIVAGDQSCGITCAHTAIIPTNKTMEVRAAASSTNIFRHTVSPLEHKKNDVLFLFSRQARVFDHHLAVNGSFPDAPRSTHMQAAKRAGGVPSHSSGLLKCVSSLLPSHWQALASPAEHKRKPIRRTIRSASRFMRRSNSSTVAIRRFRSARPRHQAAHAMCQIQPVLRR